MKRLMLAGIAVAVLAASASGAPAPAKAAPAKAGPAAQPKTPPKPPREPTRLETLTKQVADFEAKVRTEKDPAQRQALLERIEQFRHEMGPNDANGARNHPQAMWHDAAIDQLENEAKRLSTRPKTGTSASLGIDARIYVRKMAATCLARAWAWGGTLPKYQFDAYGQYLANNLGVLDALFDEIAAALAKEATLPPAVPDRDALVAAMKDAKDGLAQMGKATDDFVKADAGTPKGREAMMATLPSFTQGVQSVYEASLTLRELADKQRKGEPPAANPAQPTAAAAEPAAQEGPTADDKRRLEKIRVVTAAIAQDTTWLKIQTALDRYATVAEQGLQVPRARPGALEMLDALARIADYIENLTKSKSAYPEHVAARQESILTAFEYVADKGSRRHGYAMLRRISEGDAERRTLDASPLPADAAQGVFRALGIGYGLFPRTEEGENDWTAFRRGVDAIIDILAKMPNWPPKDMTGQLLPLYKQSAEAFVKSAEAAGKLPQTDPPALKQPFAIAGTFGRDLERLVKADQTIKAVAQYVPGRAQPMYAELLRSAEGIAGSITPTAMAERTRLDQFFLPFLQLADLQLPAPEHQKVCNNLTGGSYAAALGVFSRQLTQGVTDASRGRSAALDTAMEAAPMFRLLRHRAVAQTSGCEKLSVTDMYAFSMPEKTWTAFVASLDQHVRQVLGQYTAPLRPRPVSCQFLGEWDQVYCWVASAQRATYQARRPGDSEMEMLLRNLTAASDPQPTEAAWFGWMIGYHATEASTALTAGYGGTAGWHRSTVHENRQTVGLSRPFTAEALDPRK